MWATAVLPQDGIDVHQTGPPKALLSHCWELGCPYFLPALLHTPLVSPPSSLPCCSQCGTLPPSPPRPFIQSPPPMMLSLLPCLIPQPPSDPPGSSLTSPLYVSKPTQNPSQLHSSHFLTHHFCEFNVHVSAPRNSNSYFFSFYVKGRKTKSSSFQFIPQMLPMAQAGPDPNQEPELCLASR